MEASAMQSALLSPINTDLLPKPEADAPLFLPADARRLWYLGFLEHWEDYQRHAIQHWESEGCTRAFEEIRDHELDEPRPAAPAAVEEYDGPTQLEDIVRREALEIVEAIYNKLLATATMKQTNGYEPPESVYLVKACPYIGNQPQFWIGAKPAGRDHEMRLCGHMEYLGGRPAALTWAVGQAAKNSWGSLRCVLGDLAWYMFENNITYGFLLSSDEIMFVRFDIDTCVEEVDILINMAGMRPCMEWVDTVEEPRLWYSDPIKFTEAFDSAEGKITAKLGLLHLIHEVVTNKWKMQYEKGRCGDYFQVTEAGEKWVPKPPKGL